MPLPLLSPPLPELTGAPLPDDWSGPYGSPLCNSRIPVWPEIGATFLENHDFSPSLPTGFSPEGKPTFAGDDVITHAAGDLSEYKSVTHDGDATISVARGMTRHGYIGSPYSLCIRPAQKKDTSRAISESAAASVARTTRIFIGTDATEIFAPEQGFVFHDVGDGTNQSVELALVNPDNVPKPPRLQVLIGGVPVFTTDTFQGGYPQYAELYVKRSATTEVRLWFEDPSKPAFQVVGPVISAANCKVSRFGTLRWLGESDAPVVTVYLSGITGESNHIATLDPARLKTYSFETLPPGYNAQEIQHGRPAALDGDWVWFPSGSNSDLNSETVEDQLVALPLIDTLQPGYFGPIEPPWVKASWATEIGFVEFAWGYYMEPTSPSTAAARWTGGTLGENSAVGLTLRLAPQALSGSFEIWSWMATAAKTGWRLIAEPTSPLNHEYRLRLELWVAGVNKFETEGIGEEIEGVLIDPDDIGGTIYLVQLGGEVFAYVRQNESSPTELVLSYFENFIGTTLLSPYAGIGVNEHWYPSVVDFSIGEIIMPGSGGEEATPGLRALNTRAPGHRPVEFTLRNDKQPVDVMFSPVVVDDYIMWPSLHTSGTNISVLDKQTGGHVGDVFLKNVSIDAANVPFSLDHGIFFVDVAGTGYLVDPQLLELRWSQPLLVNNGTQFSTQIFPMTIDGSETAFIVSTLRSTTVWFTFYDSRGQVIKDLKSGIAPSAALNFRYVDSDRRAFFQGTINGHRKLYALTFATAPEDVTGTEYAAGLWSTTEIGATEYPLSDQTNFGYACNSHRRPYMALTTTNLAYCRANPSYATNSKPQKIQLFVVSKSSFATVFSATVAENTTGNTSLGCKLGSVQTDEGGNVYVVASIPNVGGEDRWFLKIYDSTGALVSSLQVADLGPYPLPASGQGGLLTTYLKLADANTPYESFLNVQNRVKVADVQWSISAETGLQGETVGTQLERVPLELAPVAIEGGGVVELLLKKNGELERIAMANDVTTGLKLTRDLTSLTSLNFSIPWDVFVVSPDGTHGTLRELQAAWEAEHEEEGVGPYNKVNRVRDNIYMRYTDPKGNVLTFRIQNLDTEEVGALEGVAVHASQELSDSLTQYKPGRSQFAGLTATEIVDHVLAGDQSVRVQNRRFVRDSLPRLDLITEVPDQSQIGDTLPASPIPYIAELVGVSPEQAAQFSGLPHETVPPHGTTRNLATGFVGYHAFNDEKPGGIRKTFCVFAKDGPVAGPINWSATPPAVFFSGENAETVTRVVYGAIKADVSGVYSFKTETDDGMRIWFRGQKVYDNFAASVVTTAKWTAEMEAGKWYPFIFHHINGTGPQVLKFYWTVPGASEVLVPADHLSHQMHGGLILTRMVDQTGSQCFVLCYKRWDGRALVMAMPLPYKIPSPSYTAQYTEKGLSNYHWPVGAPPGTTIEELRWPNDPSVFPALQVIDWGTGWTRRPGPRFLTYPHLQTASFQHRAEDYD
jgi:hypothetical protein